MCHDNNERLLQAILGSLDEIVDNPCILNTAFGIVMLENKANCVQAYSIETHEYS